MLFLLWLKICKFAFKILIFTIDLILILLFIDIYRLYSSPDNAGHYLCLLDQIIEYAD